MNTGGCDGELVDAPAAHAFDSAARRFLEVSACATGHYDAPGLGEWSVRDLLGHTSRSLSTVETYLDVASADSGPVDPDRCRRVLTGHRRRRAGRGSDGRAERAGGPGTRAGRGSVVS